MKPLHLQIAGLNSFREKVSIDFDKLLAGGLFGIFGPTGSGKSTILDAMTLALYGRVTRAPGGTHGIVNVREQNCSVSFSFEIGHDDARRRYTIDRVLGRNKTGGVETRRVRLLRHDKDGPVPIADKKHELKERINDILGITADDFLRAVVLPQGAFAEFLELETRERGAVLQRLFGLHDFGDRLNSLLKERATALLGARAEAEGSLQQLRAYDDTALAAAENGVAEAVERRRIARESLERSEKNHQEASSLLEQLEEYQSLLDGAAARQDLELNAREARTQVERARRSRIVATATEASQRALERCTESEARHREASLALDDAATRLATMRARMETAATSFPSRFDILGGELEVLARAKEGKDLLREHQERLRGVMAEYASVAERCDTAASAWNMADAQRHKREKQIERLEHELRDLDITSDERRAFDDMRQILRDLENLRENIDTGELEIKSLLEQIQEGEQALPDILERQRQLREQTDLLTAELEQLNHRSHETELDLRARTRQHDILRTALAEAEEKERAIAEKRDELTTLESTIQQTNQALREQHIELNDLLLRESAARNALDAAEALREQSHQHRLLVSLAEHLHDGSPCLLCGAEHHPLPYDGGSDASQSADGSDAELARLEDLLREEQEQVRSLEKAIAETQAAVNAAEGRKDDLQVRIVRQETGLRNLLNNIQADTPVDSVAALYTRIDAAELAMRTARDVMEHTAQATAEIQTRLNRLRADHLETVQPRSELETLLKLRKNVLRDLQSAADGLRDKAALLTGRLAAHAGGRSIEEIQAMLLQRHEHDRSAEELRARIEAEREALAGEKDAFGTLDRDLRELERNRDTVDGERRSLESDIAQLGADVAARLARAVPEDQRHLDVELLMELRREEREGIRKEFEQAKHSFDESVALEMVAREKEDNCRTEVHREQRARDEADARARELLREQGFASFHESESAALPEQEIAQLQASIDETVAALAHAARRIDELGQSIGGRRMEPETLAGLQEDMALAREEDDSAARELGAAQERLRECREKNIELKRVMEEDVMHAESTATLEQLTRYLRGNAFVDFLANERLSEICRHASVRLDVLSGGRFELGSRPKSGFYIRDNGNAGVERLPSSLSGGETFVVSLSLALALSEAVQLGRAPLEFFFLDEGFGALDEDLVDTVISSLERVRSEHRAIGVISHVAQLRERIPRRLIVTPASERGGSTVCYEMA